MLTKILIIGASGHAKVVIETIKANEECCQIVLTDQDSAKVGQQLFADTPIRPLENWENLPLPCHIAIGNNLHRKQLSLEAEKHERELFTTIHPVAHVSPSASIGNGCFIAPQAVVGAETQISAGCIINHGAIVDHDCQIGAYSHIAPNATLCGGVEVGQSCLIGAGATLLPGVKVGSYVVIGAGAVITSDVPDHQTVFGMPGKSNVGL